MKAEPGFTLAETKAFDRGVADAAWRGDGNPLNYEHHGLKSVCVSAGDLASLVEEIEAEVQEHDLSPEVLADLQAKHVLASLPRTRPLASNT